jgi:cell division protein FtsZ
VALITAPGDDFGRLAITIPTKAADFASGRSAGCLQAANDVLLAPCKYRRTIPGGSHQPISRMCTGRSERHGDGIRLRWGEDRARVAAEAAIASPLLEDVNLMGAHGILVNVTAGMDMCIGEFEEVGNTVKSFASENATVVVGTVIDPEMRDELRVTVVATGLGQEHKKQSAEKPVSLVRRPEPGGGLQETRQTDRYSPANTEGHGGW